MSCRKYTYFVEKLKVRILRGGLLLIITMCQITLHNLRDKSISSKKYFIGLNSRRVPLLLLSLIIDGKPQLTHFVIYPLNNIVRRS